MTASFDAVPKFVVLVAILASSCQGVHFDQPQRGVHGPTATSGALQPREERKKKHSAGQLSKMSDRGDFLVEHTTVKKNKHLAIARTLRNDRVLEKATENLNRSLKLPRDVVIRTRECGEINAFYDPSDHSISVCFELMIYFFDVFKLDGDSDQHAIERMSRALKFVLLHEVGHALIDNYELPITSDEEDAADSCSSFICIREFGEDGVQSIVAAAEAFAISPRIRNQDEHLLNEKRFVNSLCKIYGSDPSRYSSLRQEHLLPAARAERCPSEYERSSKSWADLLGPWSKD